MVFFSCPVPQFYIPVFLKEIVIFSPVFLILIKNNHYSFHIHQHAVKKDWRCLNNISRLPILIVFLFSASSGLPSGLAWLPGTSGQSKPALACISRLLSGLAGRLLRGSLWRLRGDWIGCRVYEGNIFVIQFIFKIEWGDVLRTWTIIIILKFGRTESAYTVKLISVSWFFGIFFKTSWVF